MTSETRTTIQLSDLKAIEFECQGCHCRISRPVGGQQQLMLVCPECGSSWATHRGVMEYLIATISRLPKAAIIDDPNNQAPFIVRFEIAPQVRKEP